MKERSVPRMVFDFLASFGLAITVLSLLLLLTVLGTLEQTHTSLFEVQRRYFESLFVVHKVGPIPLPLPGVYLLLVILFINLVCGGIVRIRKDKTTWGIIIGHLGVLLMFVGSFVEFTWSLKGRTTLAEGMDAAEFQSYYEWEIAVAKIEGDGPVTEFVVPGERFMHLHEGERATFTSPEIPFDLVVFGVFENCMPTTASHALAVDGMGLTGLPKNKEAEQDLAGAYATIQPKDGSAATRGILWANENFPMSAIVGGARWTIGFSHRRWKLPFAIHLDDFRKEDHPGLSMAKAFESDVTKTQGGVQQKVTISMNAPLRQDGYTLYQSGFQAPDEGGRGRWYSTFSVVKNPADQVPLIACIVISVGLLMHLSQKLIRHVRSQTARRAA